MSESVRDAELEPWLLSVIESTLKLIWDAKMTAPFFFQSGSTTCGLCCKLCTKLALPPGRD